jgi:hypothetical protein
MGHVWHAPPGGPHAALASPGWHICPIGSQQLPLQGDAPAPQLGEHLPMGLQAFPASQLSCVTQPHVPPSRHALPFETHSEHVPMVPQPLGSLPDTHVPLLLQQPLLHAPIPVPVHVVTH